MARFRDFDSEDHDGGSGRNSSLIFAIPVVGAVLLVGAIITTVLTRNDNVNPGQNPFVPANNNSLPEPNDDDPLKPEPGVVRLPTPNHNLTGAAMSVVDGHVAVLSYGNKGFRDIIDVVHAGTGKVAGQVVRDNEPFEMTAVSRDGRHLAVLESKAVAVNSISLYTVGGGSPAKTFRPYPKKGESDAPELIWVAFTKLNDQLITIHEAGGFDVWSVPEFERLASVRNTFDVGARLYLDKWLTKTPGNFAISLDREKVAIFNGKGFTIYSAQGTVLCKTPDFVVDPVAPLFSGAAFSPDGLRFASYYETYGGGERSHLHIWDAVKGTSINEGPVDVHDGPSGMAFWGPKHLVFHEAGSRTARVIDLATRREVGKVKTAEPGRFVTVPPDGNLWAVVSDGRKSQDKNTTYLTRATPPTSLPAGSEWQLSSRGLEAKIKAP